MTPEQRLDRVERMLIRMVQAGRRIRTEWRYKINSLIDAQIKHEMACSAETDVIRGLLNRVAVAQDRNEKEIAKLARSVTTLVNKLSQDRNGKT